MHCQPTTQADCHIRARCAASPYSAQTVCRGPTQIAATPDAQTLPEDRGADGLWQTLRKLHTWASVMMIVAHPDDEDGGMLTLESRGAGARVAMLTLTRGEGGQNAMSSETYDALGLIRTNELLRADRVSAAPNSTGRALPTTVFRRRSTRPSAVGT